MFHKCQDVILHQAAGINDDFRQMQIPVYVNKKDQQGVCVPIANSKD